MSDESITRLQQMDKEELIKQVLSLEHENESLHARLQEDGRAGDDIFQIITDNIHVAIYVFGDQGKVIYTNPFSSTLTGYTRNELLKIPLFELIHPDHRQKVMERGQKRFSGETPPDHYDTKIQVKGGGSRWVELHVKKLEIDGRKIILGTAMDMKTKKKSEDDLRRSEEKFRAFTENLQVMVYTYDSLGKVTYVNHICEKVTGYSRDELLGMNFTDILHEDYRNVSVKRAEIRRTGKEKVATYQIKIVQKDGNHRWVELSGIKLEENREETTVLGNAIDITDRVESELALKESEEKFKSMFEHSSDPMLLLGEETFLDCNLAAMKLLKAKSKEKLHIHPARISPTMQPDSLSSREKAIAMIAEAHRTGFHRFEWMHCDLEGRKFWADISLTIIPYENRKILFVVMRDISAFKKLEFLLREEREQLLVTLRSIGDAVITTDLESRIVLMNRIAERLTGWPQAEARDRKIDEVLTIFNARTGKQARNPLDQAIKQGTVLKISEETLLRSRLGQDFLIANSASPIRNEKSEIIGGVLVFRDITDHNRMQEEVLKLRKLESIGRLAGGIAHDFNNLLTGVIGNIEFAARQLDPQAKNAHENLEKAMKASLRASDLTQKLLTFAKGGDPIKKSTAINEVIKDSAEFSLLGSNVALKFEIDDNLWAAEVDAGQISQMIQNLVINAAHAMPEGGTITIRSQNIQSNSTQIAAPPLKAGPYVKISVRDQGCGITEDVRDKIFDPFYTTKQEGSGLGLSVVHSIVSKHGGYIDVQSEPGNFTEFTIFLPALGKVPIKMDESVPQETKPITTGHILIMDDEKFIREILTEILNNFGYEVTAVNDGQQVLEKYQQQDFSLVILDLTIPGGLGGKETIKLLREFDPQVKAIVSSGYSNDPVVAEYEKYGFCGYLNKPYVIKDITRLLEKVSGN
jgi:PAS domain S-box-containing protein